MSLKLDLRGAYGEGFAAFQQGKAATDNPYINDPLKLSNHNSWNSGFSYASRVCALCGRTAAKDVIRIFLGRLITSFQGGMGTCSRYGITEDQGICMHCYNLKCPPNEHLVYAWGDEWKDHVRRAIESVDSKNAEAAYREIKYYGVPTRDKKRYHAFVIVTNGDRYDIRNPHVSDAADDMVSFTKEELLKVVEEMK